jgi:hypothetical protein
MKRLLIIMLFIVLVALPCLGAFTRSIDDRPTYKHAYRWTGKPKDLLYDWAQEVEDRLTGVTAIEYSSYTATDTEPGTTAGMLYYDLSENKFKFYNGSSWTAIEAGANADSLDAAYSIGSAVDVDSATVGLTANNSADVIALTVTQNDTGATVAQTIVSAGTGALLTFDSNGTGADILGSDSTWTITKAGALTCVGITNTGDMTWTNTNYDILLDVSADQLEFQDNAQISFGTGEDVEVYFDATDLVVTFDDLDINFGADGAGGDIYIYSEAASSSAVFTEETDDLLLTAYDIDFDDNSNLVIGSDDEWVIDNASEVLTFLPSDTDDDFVIALGNATNTTDLNIFGKTASTVSFDASADKVTFNAYDIAIGDDDIIEFGDATDITIAFDSAGSDLNILGDTLEVAFGVSDSGMDVIMHGATAGEYFMWDESADSVITNCGNVLFTTVDAEANGFKVDATGAIAGDAITLETTAGGIILNADGAADGDIELNSADDLILTSAGKVTVTNTEAVTISGAQTTEGAATFNGTIVGDGATTVVGTKRVVEEYAGAGNTITIAESGSVFTNEDDADGSLHTLPEVSTCIGCEFTFVVTVAQEMVIELDNSDIFLHLTLNAGDQIQSSTVGDSITVIGLDDSDWGIKSVYPTAADWADGGA